MKGKGPIASPRVTTSSAPLVRRPSLFHLQCLSLYLRDRKVHGMCVIPLTCAPFPWTPFPHHLVQLEHSVRPLPHLIFEINFISSPIFSDLKRQLASTLRERRVRLNVGGQVFVTYASTLAKHPETLLGVRHYYMLAIYLFSLV